MQIIMCDHCKKKGSPTSMTELLLAEYTETETKESIVDLCKDCTNKLYLWLSGDYDENTTKTK